MIEWIDAEIARLHAVQLEAVRDVSAQKIFAETHGVSHREVDSTKGVRDAWIVFSEARGGEKALRQLKEQLKRENVAVQTALHRLERKRRKEGVLENDDRR